MYRDRSWRRYKQDLIFVKRIKRQFSKSSQWWYFLNSNGDEIEHPRWIDLVGCKHINFFKCDKTDKHSSKIKNKYSLNRTKRQYYRPKYSDNYTTGCRESDKRLLFLILRENGFK
jgi:hypothetical protein